MVEQRTPNLKNTVLELLAVGLQLYHVRGAGLHAIVLAVYVPLSARTAEIIHSAVIKLTTNHPSAFVAIPGDFNHASLSLNFFYQFVDCIDSGNRTLNLLYANANQAYIYGALPHMGSSEHKTVHLNPNLQTSNLKATSHHQDQ